LARKRGGDSESAVARVLDYFRRHPACIDDLEGIARWRLLDERVDRVVTETARALDRLVRDGLLERIDTPGLRQRYRLAQPSPGADGGAATRPARKKRSSARRPPGRGGA
jgi:hypothetical protein